MAADQRFEIELSNALRQHLDAASGPHGRWLDSPAAGIVANQDRVIVRPGRAPRTALLLAAALTMTLLVGALVVGAGIGRRDAIVPPTTSPSVGPTPTLSTATPTATASRAAVVVTPQPDPQTACSYFTTKDAQALWPGRELRQAGCGWSSLIRGARFGIGSSYPLFGVSVASSSARPGGGSDLSYDDALAAVSADSVRMVRGLGDKAFIARGFEGKVEGSIFRCCDNSNMDWQQAAIIVVRSGTTVIEIRAWASGGGMVTSDRWSARSPVAKRIPSDDTLIRAARLELARFG